MLAVLATRAKNHRNKNYGDVAETCILPTGERMCADTVGAVLVSNARIQTHFFKLNIRKQFCQTARGN